MFQTARLTSGGWGFPSTMYPSPGRPPLRLSSEGAGVVSEHRLPNPRGMARARRRNEKDRICELTKPGLPSPLALLVRNAWILFSTPLPEDPALRGHMGWGPPPQAPFDVKMLCWPPHRQERRGPRTKIRAIPSIGSLRSPSAEHLIKRTDGNSKLQSRPIQQR